MGAGRTELARSVFGQSYGPSAAAPCSRTARRFHAQNAGQAITAGLAYVTEDRKALGLNLLDSIKVSITSAGLKKIKKGLAVDDNLEVLAAEKFRASLNIKSPDVEEGVSRLSGGNQQKSSWPSGCSPSWTSSSSTSPRAASTSVPSTRSTRSSTSSRTPAAGCS